MNSFGRDGQRPVQNNPAPVNHQQANAQQSVPQRRGGSISWTIGLIGLFIWSALALIGYYALDGLLGWLATSGDSVLATGRDVGTLVGAEQEVGAVVDNMRQSGLWQQIIGLLQALLMPISFVIWFLGAIVILILPKAIGFVIGLFRGRSHQ